MFRDKRLMTGLGAGLMLGAMLLQLMVLATSGTDAEDPFSVPGETPDEEQLRLEAEQLGFLLQDASEQWYTRAEVDKMIREALEEREAAPAATAGKPASGEADSGATAGTVSDNGALPHYYLIEIRAGMASDEVGEMLHAAGLVDDLDAYREKMARLGLTVKIRAGTYTFAYKPELEALIDAITLPTR